MNYEEIISLVLHILSAIGYVIIMACAIIKKIKRKHTTNADSGIYVDNVLDTCLNILNEMGTVEELYHSVFKDGIKAGAFKLRDVLNKLKEVCAEKQLPYNEEQWKSFIQKVVCFQNMSSNTLDIIDDEKNKIQGVQYNES